MTWLAYSHLGVAKRLTLDTQPGGALAGIPFVSQPVGRLLDGSGVLSRTTGTVVTVSKLSGVGTLSGTLTAVTVEGVFTFTDLKMDTVTGTVVLQFNAPGLVSVDSNSFNVTQPNTTIGCEVGTYAITGTAQTLTRGPYMMRQDAVGSYTVTGTGATLTWSGESALIDTDFSEFANITEVQAASWWYSTDYTTISTTSGVSLDTTTGYGASDRCMSLNFQSGDFPGWGFGADLGANYSELWIEFWAKCSTSWTSGGSGSNNPDHKLFFLLLEPAASLARDEFKIGEYGTLNRVSVRYQGGPDTIFIFAASNLNDNTWHRYRMHSKLTPGSANGIFNTEFWDGTNSAQQQLQTGITRTSTYVNLRHLYLGANRNRPPTTSMSIKFGSLTVYDADPGWGI